MMLYELFSWIHSSQEDALLCHKTIRLTDFECERTLAIARRRELLAAVCSSRYEPSATLSASKASANLEQHDAYVKFMDGCHQYIIEQDNLSLTLLGLKYVLFQDVSEGHQRINQHKINRLFSMLLLEHKQMALEFYAKHQTEFEPFASIKFKVDVLKTADFLLELTQQLMAQKNPISVVPLFRAFIDDTEKFAAIILWLLQRGVSVDTILKTDLLQNFMSYNLDSLGLQEGSIKHLYELLFQFPEAKALIEAAGNVQCEERGFHCSEGGKVSYALTGVMREHKRLRRVEVKAVSVEFDSSEENFNALYQLFDIHFIKLALAWQFHNQCDTWQTSLHSVLNRERVIALQLPALINHTAVDCPPGRLERLADLLDDDSVDLMVSRRCGAVLHLLCHKSNLRKKISTTDVAHYLQEILAIDTPIYDLIPQLMATLIAFRGVNKTAAILVYETILDVLLKHPQFLDDRSLIKLLKKFSEKDAIFAKLYANLQSQFQQSVFEQLQHTPLLMSNYHIIEDAWLTATRKFSLLNEIEPSSNPFPGNKYKLQTYVAHGYLIQHPGHFPFDDFIQAIGVTPLLIEGSVSEFERLLVEMLTTIDDESIRIATIAQFQTTETTSRRWISTEYGEGCVLDRAASQGNIGLIRWLMPKINFDNEGTTRAVVLAAKSNQWAVVDYFCSFLRLKPQSNTLKDILRLAAEMGQLSTVTLLCEDDNPYLKNKHIVQAFVKAAANGHLAVVQYLCGLPAVSSIDSIIANAIKRAVQSERLDIIEFLGNLPKNDCLSNAVESVLVHEIVRDHLQVVQQLCGLKTNAPSRVIIEKAFIKALECGHVTIAKYICDLPSNSPRQAIIDDAFVRLVASGSSSCMEMLCASTTHYPSQVAIERALQQAAKLNQLDTIRLLCRMERTPPRPRALKDALNLAAIHGHLPIVAQLCQSVPQTMITSAFHLAAQQGHLGCVRYCYNLTSLGSKALESAYKKARSKGHLEVAHYLNGLLAVAPASMRHDKDAHFKFALGIKRSASCGALSTLGMFGLDNSIRRHRSVSDHEDPKTASSTQ